MFFCDLDIYYLRIEIILVVQNCLHGLTKNILQKYRVHTFLNKFRSQLRMHFIVFFLPKLMIHLYSSIDKAAVQEKKQTTLFITG